MPDVHHPRRQDAAPVEDGIRRCARRIDGSRSAFIAAIGKTRTLARRPKPGISLREIELATIATDKPTSEGIAETLARLDLHSHRVGLQPDRDERCQSDIIRAIGAMADGRVDAIALTSSGQVRRLVEVARIHRCEDRLLGARPHQDRSPVISAELKAYGLRTDITPANDAFFMKPLIGAMAASLNAPGG